MDITEYDKLYRELAPLVFRRAFTLLKDEEEARDCVQSAFLALWEQRLTVTNAAAFVNTAVTNRVRSHYRTLSTLERFQRLYPIEIEGQDESGPSMQDVIVYIDSNLSEAVSRVVRCVFFMKMSYKDTARELGISESTVNKHVVTALRALRNHFKSNQPDERPDYAE